MPRSDLDERLARLEKDGFVARLHSRDASLWSADAATQSAIKERLGWLIIAEKMAGAAEELRAFAGQVRDAGIRDVVLLGIGGSSLAPEVLRATLGVAPGYPHLTVLDTTDPVTVLALERKLDLSRTLFIVASKSGATIEVLSLFAYFRERLGAVKAGSEGESFIAITDEGTPLQALAREHRFRCVFLNPSDVGGRFSALSYFGMVPAALIGADVGLLLRRAAAMAEVCASGSAPADNPGVWLGATLGELALAGRDKLTLLPSLALAAFGGWVEQLVAESTGKEGRGILPVEGEPPASPDVYGDDRLFVQLRLETDASSGDALEALRRAGHPVVDICLQNPYDLGAEFYRWEVATATAAAILGVNPFDEPNVAESKANTEKLLEIYRAEGALPEGTPAFSEDAVAVFAERPSGGLAEALASLVRRLRPGGYLALAAYLPETPAVRAALQSMRLALRDATKAATTLGFGPRYLHSTGQLHKGGRDNGVFLLFTSDDAEDAAVPGQPYTFGVLKRAQALGDLEALRRRRRPVLRLHLQAGVEAGLARVASALASAVETDTR